MALRAVHGEVLLQTAVGAAAPEVIGEASAVAAILAEAVPEETGNPTFGMWISDCGF